MYLCKFKAAETGLTLLDQRIAANRHKMLFSGLSRETWNHTINFTPSGPHVPTDGGKTTFFITTLIQ